MSDREALRLKQVKLSGFGWVNCETANSSLRKFELKLVELLAYRNTLLQILRSI